MLPLGQRQDDPVNTLVMVAQTALTEIADLGRR
jgi:hypothetical protein